MAPETGSPWEFDGNYEAPTFSPSMLANRDRMWEEHLTLPLLVENGHWWFLKDSTHHLASQTVPMIPPDPAMTWEQRQGRWHTEFFPRGRTKTLLACWRRDGVS